MTLVFGVFAIAFLSGGILELLALVLPAWASYAILGGVFILLVVVTIGFRKYLIVDPIARFVSKLVFDSQHKGNDGTEKKDGKEELGL